MYIPPMTNALAFVSPLELIPNDAPYGGEVRPVLFALEKYCERCKSFALSDDFVPDRRTSHGLGAWCRACDNARNRGKVAKPETSWRRSYRQRCRQYRIAYSEEPFTREQIVERDGNGCAECGVLASADSKMVLDHIVPVAAGGPHTLANVQILCGGPSGRGGGCNGRKGRTSDRALIAGYKRGKAS